MSQITSDRVGLFLGPILFLVAILFARPVGLSGAGVAVLATTFWIAIWWITEAVPISVTALLPIVLFPITGALSLADTTASYGHKYIFLYIGGFILAIAIERWHLHRRIALNIINFIGVGISKIILGFMLATAFLSMWISNTATAVMMLPIGMAIVAQLADHPDTEENEQLLFGKSLMLAIAYSASIGGMATLIGTPPNLVLAGVVQENYGVDISFAQWFVFGAPISIVLLTIAWVYLTKVAYKIERNTFPGGKVEIERLLTKLGPLGFEEKVVLMVFLTTAGLWIGRGYLQQFVPALDDTIIAMMAALTLFVLPAKGGSRALLTWEEAVKLPWGILILFGGGMALAAAFKDSGLAPWLGSQMTLLSGLPLLVLLLILVTAVNFLTEITSNIATTAMLLPILAAMAVTIGIHPFYLLVAATVAASCAFMLPVATPPNAVVFGSGYLTIPDMVKTGLWLNLLSIVLVTLFVYFLLPLVWNLRAIG